MELILIIPFIGIVGATLGEWWLHRPISAKQALRKDLLVNEIKKEIQDAKNDNTGELG